MSRLGANVVHFARLLRSAGVPVGPGQALAAARAVGLAGVDDKLALRQALFATLVTRRAQMPLFDQAFELFWRDPQMAGRAMAMLMPMQKPEMEPAKVAGARRLAEALNEGRGPQKEAGEQLEIDMTLTASADEVLRQKDFEQMNSAELADARRMVERLPLEIEAVETRRWAAAVHGQRIDLRRTLRQSLRAGGGIIRLAEARRRVQPPPIVALCDISGSMAKYARVFLHFLHALTEARRRRGQRVSTFVFGTRLTNATRALKHRDIDEALDAVGRDAGDWGGGTRIGTALKDFNFRWSRRVLGQGAVVLLITDGLDRDEAGVLGIEAERLARSCRTLIWLNPLLRYAQFQPRASGIRALLPHVDRFLPLYSVETLADLSRELASSGRRGHLGLRQAA
ncbi:MAG: VWA domain-containing protein [Alphaproteobacteria bacterium]|nr:VWA domain-containing protein [Alphaproteobacteria bacterium]